MNIHVFYVSTTINGFAQDFTYFSFSAFLIDEFLKQKNIHAAEHLVIRKNIYDIHNPIITSYLNSCPFFCLKGTVPLLSDGYCIQTYLELKTHQYTPNNALHSFLFKYDILLSYYEQKITFLIETCRVEFSREFGQRYFRNKTHNNFLYQDVFQEVSHSSHIYHSLSNSYVLEIKGIDDNGNLIHHVVELPYHEPREMCN